MTLNMPGSKGYHTLGYLVTHTKYMYTYTYTAVVYRIPYEYTSRVQRYMYRCISSWSKNV